MAVSSDGFTTELAEWCRYHFTQNLVSIGLFDPRKTDPSYPSSDVNVLIVLRMAPKNERERYDLITEMLVKNLAPGRSLTCRVQTVEELDMLAELRLPLLNIYLNEIEIVYDPKNVLKNMCEKI
jgi:hypothetical protein